MARVGVGDTSEQRYTDRIVAPSARHSVQGFGVVVGCAMVAAGGSAWTTASQMRRARAVNRWRLTSRSSKCYDSAMRALAVVTVMAMMLLPVSACGDDDSSDDAATEETVAVDVPDVIGDSVEDATATLEDAGLTLRVVSRDGEDLASTADFVENRVNVAVETQDDGTEVVTEVVSIG